MGESRYVSRMCMVQTCYKVLKSVVVDFQYCGVLYSPVVLRALIPIYLNFAGPGTKGHTERVIVEIKV